MPQYYVWTIGCQMNKAESERIAGYLDAAGYRDASSFAEADVIVLNTCVVRQSAEDRVLGTLGLLKGLKGQHPQLSILVTGCFVDSNTEGLMRAFPHVNLFFRPGAYSELAAWAEQQGVSTAEVGRHLSIRGLPTRRNPVPRRSTGGQGGLPLPALSFLLSRAVTTSAPTVSCPIAGGER